MQGSSNNSFIPKRRTSTRQSTKPGRKIFVVTIIAYSLLFASLLAAAGTLLYKNYTIGQLESEAVLLDGAVNTFSVQAFKRVQEFDETLTQARVRVDNTVSVVSILDEIDRVVAQPIQINTLQLERNDDQEILMTLDFSTETLDAALFQRKLLNVNSALFTQVDISEVTIQSLAEVVSADEVVSAPRVSFVAVFVVPVPVALFDPAEARRTDLGGEQSGQISVTPSDPNATVLFDDRVQTEEINELESSVFFEQTGEGENFDSNESTI